MHFLVVLASYNHILVEFGLGSKIKPGSSTGEVCSGFVGGRPVFLRASFLRAFQEVIEWRGRRDEGEEEVPPHETIVAQKSEICGSSTLGPITGSNPNSKSSSRVFLGRQM